MSLKVSQSFKDVIKAHLDKCAAEDAMFAVSYGKEGKSVDECCNFILMEVKRFGVSGMSDEEVFGLAKHYYDEDNLGEIKLTQCKVVVNHHIDLTEEEKAEARRKAIEAFEKEELAKLREDSKPKDKVQSKPAAQRVAPVKDSPNTPSLFDFGSDEA